MGIIRFNDRYVVLKATGVLTYYHLDKPTDAKGNIQLASSEVTQVLFSYAAPTTKSKIPSQSEEPAASINDEFRIVTANGETFIFKPSKKF